MNTQSFTFNELQPSLIADIKADLTPMLIGEPGIGKSSVLKALANKLKTKVFVLSVNQLGTKEDLTGARTIKDPNNNTYRQVFFPHADVQDAIDYAKANPKENPILFLDEINRTTSDVTSAALALITERKLGTTKLPKNLRLVAAGNDQGNVISFDDASITRLSLYHVTPDVNSFLAAQPDLNHYVVNVLKSNPSLLLSSNSASDDDDVDAGDDDDNSDDNAFKNLGDMFEGETFAQHTVPRTITYTSNYLNALGFNGSHDSTEKSAFGQYVDIVADPATNPDTLLKSLIAHTGDTDFTNQLYTNIKDELLNAFQKKTNNDASADTFEDTVEIPEPSKELVDALLKAKDVNDIDDILQKVSSDEYQTLVLNLMTKDGQQKVTMPIIDAVLSNLGENLNQYEQDIKDHADSISDETEKADYLKENTINGFDNKHKRLLIDLLTRDGVERSTYTINQIAKLDYSNENINKIQNILDLFNN